MSTTGGLSPNREPGIGPDVGWRSPWDTDRALREKGERKEVAGALPLSLSSRLSLPQSSSLQSEFSGNRIIEHG